MTGSSPALARSVCALLACGVLGAVPGRSQQAPEARDPVPAAGTAEIRFNRDVRPILSSKCFACHGPDAGHREADLRLDQREGALYVAFPGEAEESELWLRITSSDPDEVMPPPESGHELDDEERAVLRAWIDQGLEYEAHWSRTPLPGSTTPLAAGAGPAEAAARIDALVRARLDERGIAPSPRADAAALARRVTLDLTGLPPTPEAVERFAAAHEDPAAWQRMIDELLTSPRHAERMAVWWLDLVRFADTVGYHGDQEHHVAPYRDYVLKAFRDNYPFDRFTREQLGGDLIPDRTEEQWVAASYNRLLQTTHEGGAQPGEYLAKYAADRVRNVSTVWLGSTVGCAECHDHKYDPIPQRDFYRLAAFFADIDEEKMWRAPNSTPTRRPPEADVLSPLAADAVAALDERIAAAADAPAERARLEAERDELVARHTRRVMVTVAKEPRTTRVLARGDWMDTDGEVVEPGTPECLPPLAVDGRRANRLDLGEWLCRPDNPLTARVLVNRVWALFFGRGLSAELLDVGSQGAWPSHPQLLDELARGLVESGWDLRWLIRSIVLSETYRQSSARRPALADVSRADSDPTNSLLARQNRWRLEAEFIRDLALQSAGLLEHRFGGPSARPYQPPGYYVHLNFPKRKYTADTGPDQYRRGLYTHWQRMFLHPMLRAFDAPTREECTAGRPRSNTPLQALVLLNDPTFVEAARGLADRVAREFPRRGARPRIERMWRLVLGREPSRGEVRRLERLYRASLQDYRSTEDDARALLSVGNHDGPGDEHVVERAAWTTVARAVLNLHESITRY